MEDLANLNYDWFRNQKILNSPTTLGQLAAVKKAVSLWHEEEKWFVVDIDEVHRILQGKIVSMTTIPETIKDVVSEIVELIKNELYEFFKDLPHKRFSRNWWVLLRDKISWTPQGTIDYKTTAEALADFIELDVETRFKIAAKFFLENRINDLSIQMPPYYLPTSSIFPWLNKEMVFCIAGMDDANRARQHFNIEYINCDQCFRCMLTKKNNLGCNYYWKRLSEEKKLEVLNPFYHYRCYSELFVFTVYSKERKLQVLQDEEYCCRLLTDLNDLKWFSILNSCITEDFLNFLSLHSLAKLFIKCAKRLKSTLAYKKKYFQLCALLLRGYGKKLSVARDDDSQHIIIAMGDLVMEGEIKSVKDFLQSVNSEWIRNLFDSEYSIPCYLANLLFVSLKCGIMEFILISVFSTEEKRKAFFSSTFFDSAMYVLIEQKFKEKIVSHQCQDDDVDRLISTIFSCSEDVKNYKKKFAEKMGFRFCAGFLFSRKWEAVKEFVQWCFVSEEEIIHYLEKFFESDDFARFLRPRTFGFFPNSNSNAVKKKLEKLSGSVIALIKNSLVRQFYINELLFKICLKMLSQNSFTFYSYSHGNESKLFFETLDIFLVACIQDEQKKLIDLRRELFTDKGRKLCVSLPLEFLNQIQQTDAWKNKNWKEKDEIWRQMIDDFFNWICSSDKNLKLKLEEEFWQSFYADCCKYARKPIV